MSWRDNLRPASLGAAALKVEATEAQLGRRVQVHQLPRRDTPATDDLGRRAREFTIEAYVLGDDYQTARDALIAEVESEGAKQLVHPRFGALRVTVTGCKVRETTREGGYATFTLTVVEDGSRSYPSAQADTQAQSDQAADTATTRAADTFAETFSVEDQPDFVRDTALERVQAVTAALRSASARVSSMLAPVSDAARAIDDLENAAATLINAPAELAGAILAVVGSIIDAGAGLSASLAAYRSLFRFGDDASLVPTLTSARRQQSANQAALHALVQQAAVIEASRASAQADYESANEAITLRNELLDEIDRLAETASDAVFEALTALRAAVAIDLRERGARLPSLITYTPGITLPALVVAYQLYGDADRADEICARNKVRHPGFLIGGEPLEVLNA